MTKERLRKFPPLKNTSAKGGGFPDGHSQVSSKKDTEKGTIDTRHEMKGKGERHGLDESWRFSNKRGQLLLQFSCTKSQGGPRGKGSHRNEGRKVVEKGRKDSLGEKKRGTYRLDAGRG